MQFCFFSPMICFRDPACKQQSAKITALQRFKYPIGGRDGEKNKWINQHKVKQHDAKIYLHPRIAESVNRGGLEGRPVQRQIWLVGFWKGLSSFWGWPIGGSAWPLSFLVRFVLHHNNLTSLQSHFLSKGSVLLTSRFSVTSIVFSFGPHWRPNPHVI